MKIHALPERNEMMQAFLARDASYEGVFFTAVRTTGIFCRPTCPAKKPEPENVEFFATSREALFAGFRPCKRCRPLEPAGRPPLWLRRLLEEVEADPSRRWSDADLRQRGLSPDRVRRWFQRQHGLTFHAYTRARRLGQALGQIRNGDLVIDAALDQGYESLSGFNEAFRRLLGSSPKAARGAPVVVLSRIPTALGPMIAGATDEALCLLEFADRRMLETQLRRVREHLGCRIIPGSNSLLDDLRAELEQYFSGRLTQFTIPLLTPGSRFQKRVWQGIRQIPYGKATTYGELARQVGGPTAVRAVGRATGDNRIAILIPCHRVVGSDGRLTGYGGGLWRKRRLLELESGQATIRGSEATAGRMAAGSPDLSGAVH